MTTIRRIYAYLLSFASLVMLAVAGAMLAQLVLDVLVQKPLGNVEDYVRNTASLWGAAALVGLPVWLLHWLWIERTARNDPRERESTLRRLYLYALLAGAVAVTSVAAAMLLQALFDAAVESGSQPRLVERIVDPRPDVLIGFAVWLAHWRIASIDRSQVGEAGGSATLRRWYVYGAAFIGLIVLLSGAQGVLETLWRTVVTPGQPGSAITLLPVPASAAIVGLGLWLVHWSILPAYLPEAARHEDGRSVLRSVYLFLGLAVSVVGCLLGASQLLYYAVGRLLGVERPGGVGGDILEAAAGPASMALVYGAAWAYQRQAIRRQAETYAEAPRQAGIRRLYTYLVALVGLSALSFGAGGLLWVLCDFALNGHFDADSVAASATMTIVGLPVWLLHWRPVPVEVGETRSLARRLYVYLSLIAASLTLLGSAAAVLYRLLSLALGTTSSVSVLSDLAHALAIAVVAGLIAGYQWRTLRMDARRVEPPASEEPEVGPARAVVEIEAADADALSRALSALRSTGVQVTLR